MAEIGNQDQPTLPTKRKLDPDCVDRRAEVECEHGHSNKAQKVQSLAITSDNDNDNDNDNDDNNNSEHSPCAVAQQANQSTERCTTNSGFDSLKPQVNIENPEREAIGHEEDEEEEEEEEEEEVNGKDVVVDRKGKGIIMEDDEDEDEDDSDDDDSSDAGSEFDGHDGSELEDDPLAEVDLDNILPSRTRRRAVQPGVYIANDIISSDDDDDDDSDD